MLGGCKTWNTNTGKIAEQCHAVIYACSWKIKTMCHSKDQVGSTPMTSSTIHLIPKNSLLSHQLDFSPARFLTMASSL